MAVLNDRQIKELVRSKYLIDPFEESCLNPYGYDIRLAGKFLVPKPNYLLDEVLDPLNLELAFEEVESDYFLIPPNSFILGCSMETIHVPRNVVGLCFGRSTYTRCGIVPNITPLEAGWSGTITMSITNNFQIPAKVHANKGIAQIVFFSGRYPEKDYVSKGGKYQNQSGITLPRGEKK